MKIPLRGRLRSLVAQPPFSWLVRATRTVFAWQPLSGRGFAVLLLGTVAIRIFALPEYDLVADILGTSALALVVLTVFAAVIFRFLLAGRLRADARFDEASAYSKNPVAAGMTLEGSSVPPFFSLRITRNFARAGVRAPVHIVKGRVAPGEVRHLFDGVAFPHRDLWELHSVRCDLEDMLGLTRLSWKLPVNSGCEVSAPTVAIEPLPVIAATARAGDEQMQAKERTGELFDIKPYDPSDGLKRILWKTYAKSGQLVARRPEPAIIPDGEVALYLVAGPNDDVVAGACQGYVDQLESYQVRVLFGTDGLATAQGMRALGDSSAAICTSPELIRHAMNRTASDPEAGTGKGFPAFLEAVAAADRVVHQVIVFGPERFQEGWFEEISRLTRAHSLKLAVALVPSALDPDEAMQRMRYQTVLRRAPRGFERLPRLLRRAVAVFIPSFRPLIGGRHQSADLVAAAQQIQRSGADVYVVQGRGAI